MWLLLRTICDLDAQQRALGSRICGLNVSPKSTKSQGDKKRIPPVAALNKSELFRASRPVAGILRCHSRWSGLRLLVSCGRGGCSLVQDSVMNREQGKFQPVRDADFVVNIAQIVFDHL